MGRTGSKDRSPVVERLTREIRDRNLQLVALRSEYQKILAERRTKRIQRIGGWTAVLFGQ